MNCHLSKVLLTASLLGTFLVGSEALAVDNVDSQANSKPGAGQIPLRLRPLSVKNSGNAEVKESSTSNSPVKSQTAGDKNPGYVSDIDFILDGKAKPRLPLSKVVDKIKVVATRTKDLKGFYVFQVNVENRSDRTILVEGNKVIGTANGGVVNCASVQDVFEKLPNPNGERNKYLRTATNTATAFVTIGALPAIKDQLNDRGPVLKRYGYDEARREEQIKRFSDRVLYPGESTSGLAFFPTKLLSKKIKLLKMTVRDFDNKRDFISLAVKIN